MIPFASQTAPYVGTNASGASKNVGLITFGGDPRVVSLGSGGFITLGRDNQSAFTLPFNAVVDSIYVDISSMTAINIPTGITVYPSVRLYVASPGNSTFVAIPSSQAAPSSGFSGSVSAFTTRIASVKQLNLSLLAGIRIIIGGQIEISGSSGLARDYYFYFTGGIAMHSS
jgi:hypothetical protein